MLRSKRAKIGEEDEEKPTKYKPTKSAHPTFVNAPLIYQHIDNPHNAKRSDQLLHEMIELAPEGRGGDMNTEEPLCLISYSGTAWELSECIYRLAPITRACLDSVWLAKKWNCINKRCRKCLKPNAYGDCVSCVIPILHNLSTTEWLKYRCKVCHKKKTFYNALLCGSGECMMKFIMLTKPTLIPLLGWVKNERCVAATITICWTNYDPLQSGFATKEKTPKCEFYKYDMSYPYM